MCTCHHNVCLWVVDTRGTTCSPTLNRPIFSVRGQDTLLCHVFTIVYHHITTWECRCVCIAHTLHVDPEMRSIRYDNVLNEGCSPPHRYVVTIAPTQSRRVSPLTFPTIHPLRTIAGCCYQYSELRMGCGLLTYGFIVVER